MLEPILFGTAATRSTLAGGLLALRLSHRIVLILGVVAGVVLGVVVFALLPEAIPLERGFWHPRSLIAFAALGLGAYMLVDRTVHRAAWLPARWRIHLAPATLTLHSLMGGMGGMGIGIAFQIDTRVGWLGALTHDLADGVNTVSLCLAAKSEEAARRWLVLNGVAPMQGVLLGLSIAVPPQILAPLMAMFAGVLRYISASELLPRSSVRDPRLRTTLAGLAGMALMFVMTSIAH